MNPMVEPISKQRILRVMSLGDVAKIVLDPDTPHADRLDATAMLRYRLREFNGAMWVGAPLHERGSVIQALRATA